jgi:hypothetical protein
LGNQDGDEFDDDFGGSVGCDCDCGAVLVVEAVVVVAGSSLIAVNVVVVLDDDDGVVGVGKMQQQL